MRESLVGAVFPDRPAAAAASRELVTSGLGPSDLVRAIRTGEQYVVEADGTRRVGRGIVAGSIVGTVLGAVVALIGIFVFWPEADLTTALVVGIGGGGSFGVALGAYAGLLSRRPELWDEEAWEHVTVDPGQILLVVRARSEEVYEILSRHGGTIVDPTPAENGS